MHTPPAQARSQLAAQRRVSPPARPPARPTWPLSAAPSCLSVAAMTASSLLKRTSSCTSTVFMDSW